MQLGNFINVFLARHVSYISLSSGALDVELQHMIFCTELSFCHKYLMMLTQTYSRITGNTESEVEVLWLKVRAWKL